MKELQAVQIDAELWQAIQARANTAHTSPDAWLRQLVQTQSSETSPVGEPAGQDTEALYEGVMRHFRALALSPEQARAFAAVIQRTMSTGERQTVSISSEGQQRYVFQRRLSAITVRWGDRRMRLPLEVAARIARELSPTDVTTPDDSMAA